MLLPEIELMAASAVVAFHALVAVVAGFFLLARSPGGGPCDAPFWHLSASFAN